VNPNKLPRKFYLTKMFWIAAWLLIMCNAVPAFAEQEFSFKPLGLSSLRIETFLEVRQKYEDNVFQVPIGSKPQRDFVTNLWTGIDLKIRFDEKTRFSTRYEAALRKFTDFERKNRRDQLLSLLFQRKLGRKFSLLTFGNLGVRSQPNDQINNYFKQDFVSQAYTRWTSLWSSQFGMEYRRKSYPHNYYSNYNSVMAEGNLRRRMGVFSQIRGGYQFRAYRGAIDPRVLQLKPNEEMKGIRQTASIWFESMLLGQLLMDWKYQIEFDTATRGLQRQERFSKEVKQTSEFEGEHEDFDEEEAIDFNFLTHRVATMLVWRLFSNSTVSLYARHDFKSYRDWLVPTTNRQRHDDLTLLRLYFKQKLFSNLSARLEYSLEKNNSNDPTQKYTDNIYSIGLQFAF